jgi:hypothetical protein
VEVCQTRIAARSDLMLACNSSGPGWRDALEAEQAAALRRTFLELRQDDQGTCHGRCRIHDARYRTTRTPNGTVSFHRRT